MGKNKGGEEEEGLRKGEERKRRKGKEGTR